MLRRRRGEAGKNSREMIVLYTELTYNILNGGSID